MKLPDRLVPRRWRGIGVYCGWLSPRGGNRYWGYREDWYDGPIYSFGFWYFNVYAGWF